MTSKEAPMTELPAVTRSFSTFCKKCDAEKMHKVLTHVDAKTAKIECEICHKKSTFKLKAAKKVSSLRPKKPKAASAPNAPSWNELHEKFTGKAPKKYRITDRFEKDSIVEHPKFGVGFILQVTDNRIDTIFQEGLKTLVHNQK